MTAHFLHRDDQASSDFLPGSSLFMHELLEYAGRDAGQMVEADISWPAVMSLIALKESFDE